MDTMKRCKFPSNYLNICLLFVSDIIWIDMSDVQSDAPSRAEKQVQIAKHAKIVQKNHHPALSYT